MMIKYSFWQMQETAVNSLVGRASGDQAAGLASQASQTLDNQTQAYLLHHTSHNVRKFGFKTILKSHTNPPTGFGGSVYNG